MMRAAYLLPLLVLALAPPALAETAPPTIFVTRFNGLDASSAPYVAPWAPVTAYPASSWSETPVVADVPAEGRKAMMATVADWLGRVYDAALSRITGGGPAVSTATPVKLSADPRAFQAAGLKADAQVSALGLKSKMGMRLGTDEVRQTLRLSRGCTQNWLPNSLSGDVAGSFGSLSGSVQGSWGSVCSAGQTGWRLTAGMVDLGTSAASPNLGLEYRPVAGGLVSNLTGLSSVKAQLADSGGTFGLEAPVPLVRVDRMKLSADMSWTEDAGTTLKLGTKLRF